MTTLEKVTRLFDLRKPSINVVLHKLEDVQAQMGWDDLSNMDVVRLSAKEIVLKELVDEIYETEFGEGRCG